MENDHFDLNNNKTLHPVEDIKDSIGFEASLHRREDLEASDYIKIEPSGVESFSQTYENEANGGNWEKKLKRLREQESLEKMKSSKLVPVSSGKLLKADFQMYDIEEKYLHINDFETEDAHMAAITFDNPNFMLENSSHYQYDRFKGQSTRPYWNAYKVALEEREQEEQEQEENEEREREEEEMRKKNDRAKDEFIKNEGGLLGFVLSRPNEQENEEKKVYKSDSNNNKKKQTKVKEEEEKRNSLFDFSISRQKGQDVILSDPFDMNSDSNWAGEEVENFGLTEQRNQSQPSEQRTEKTSKETSEKKKQESSPIRSDSPNQREDFMINSANIWKTLVEDSEEQREEHFKILEEVHDFISSQLSSIGFHNSVGEKI